MSRTRRTALLLGAVSVALLLGALGFQYLGGLAPCEMCWWQRYAHVGVLVVAALAFALDRPGLDRRGLGWLVVLAMLVAAGLGFYHAGVELKWWQGATACTAPIATGSAADLLAALRTAPLVRCDAVPWSLFGISMAGWNGLVSAAAAIGGALLLARPPRRAA